MSITLKICDDQREWDEVVDRSPHATLFHTWKFLKIMEKHTPSKLYPLIGMKGTTPIGVYPLFFQKRFFLKTVFSPPPHCAVPYLGPLILDYDKLKQSKKESLFIDFQKAVDDFISSELRAHYVSIATPPGLDDSRPLRWANYGIRPMYNYLLDIGQGTDYVWNQVNKKLRQDINRTGKKGVVVVGGSKEDIKFVYDSLSARYEKQEKIVTTPKEYLMDIFDSFHPNNLKIFIARYQDELVGGMIDIYYNNKVTSWIGNSKTDITGLAVNDLVQWSAIEHACMQGFKHYEEVGANTPRLIQYKSKFNPELSLYFIARKYSSFMPRCFESVYHQIIKPFYSKFKK